MPGGAVGHIRTLKNKLKASGIRREEWWPPGTGEHEVAFAFNVQSLEVRWFKGDKAKGDLWKARFYPFPKWISGTADWISSSHMFIYVDDLKTGRWPVTAHGNKQLLTYAMPFWIEMGCPLECEIKLSITQWEKYPLDGLPKRNFGTAKGVDMAMHLQDLMYSLEHPDEANPDKETCRFCDCKDNCPAFMAAGFDYTRRDYG